jgi:hypothetical protein
MPHVLESPTASKFQTPRKDFPGARRHGAISGFTGVAEMREPSPGWPLAGQSLAGEADEIRGRLNSFLAEDAIDLRQISAAIRECPEFESFLLRAGKSASISAGTFITSVEEAVVILGKDRLRSLLIDWRDGGND